jgi:hypothetical protein
MEYVIVKFTESRTVLIDDNESGLTNEKLMVQEGSHDFKLEGSGYSPTSQIVRVRNTTVAHPMSVEFSQALTEDDDQAEDDGQTEDEDES